jgi:hypothetical protein
MSLQRNRKFDEALEITIWEFVETFKIKNSKIA